MRSARTASALNSWRAALTTPPPIVEATGGLLRNPIVGNDARPSPAFAELARRSSLASVDLRRFRMLIEFSGGTPHLEDSWGGTLLRIGGAVLRGAGPVKRCTATTRDPASGAVDLQTLRVITAYRGRRESELGVGATFGLYSEVLEPGDRRVGDCLRVG